MAQIRQASLWMGGAIASFSAMAVAGREMSFELDTFEIMLFRSMIGFLIVVLVALSTGHLGDVNRQRLGLHVMRNIAHFTGQNLWFFAVGAIPLAQVFSLEFLAPIWAILLAPLILKEPIRRSGLIAAALGFAGILVIARPGSTVLSPGLLAAATCGIGFALSALLTRKLTRGTEITCILFWLTLMQSVFGLICAGADGDIALPSIRMAPWLGLVAVAGLSAHFCLTSALKLAPAGVVTPIDFARLPMIALVGAAFYAEPLDPVVFAGAALIVAGNLINLRRAGG